MKYSTAFILACEESYGYLPYDFVRDKDGNASCVAFCELLAHLKKHNISISKYLDSIYIKYGYHNQNTINKSSINKIFYLFFLIGGTIFILGLININ